MAARYKLIETTGYPECIGGGAEAASSFAILDTSAAYREVVTDYVGSNKPALVRRTVLSDLCERMNADERAWERRA